MALWTPSSIPTALWLDAADSDTITLNGSNISQWDDKSGVGNHASIGVSTAQPEYISTGLNSMPVIKFDGGDEVLRGDYGGSASCTIFMVHRVTSFTSFGRRIALNSGSDTISVANSGNTNEVLVGRTNDPDGSGRLRAFTLETWAVLSAYHTNAGAGSDLLKMNGSSASLAENDTHLIAGTVPSNKYSIGARWDAAYAALEVSEIVVVDSIISESDIERIEGYLAWKWGLENNLGETHPYKMTAPTNYEFQYDPYLFSAVAALPTLSVPTAINITSSGFQPRVTATY